MSLGTVRGALSECLAYFGSLPAGPSPRELDIDRICADIAAVTAEEWARAHQEARAEVLRGRCTVAGACGCRQLGELGGALAALTAPVTAAYSRPRTGSDRSETEEQLRSAFRILIASCELAATAGISGSDAYRFARCGQLVLAGRHAVSFWILAAATLGIQPDGSWVSAGLESREFVSAAAILTGGQLLAMRSLLTLLSQAGQERTLAAFAATVATPAEALRWLTVVATFLRLAGGAGAPIDPVLQAFPSVCAIMLAPGPFAKQRAALRTAKQQQEQLAAVLPLVLQAVLTHLQTQQHSSSNSSSSAGGRVSSAGVASAGASLGASGRGAGGSGSGGEDAAASVWEPVAHVLQLLTEPCLQGGIRELLLPAHAGPGDTRTVQLVADIVSRLPAQRSSAGMSAEDYGSLLTAALCAWSQVVHVMTPDAHEGEQWSPERYRAARCALQLLPAMSHAARHLARDADVAAAGKPDMQLIENLYYVLLMAHHGAQEPGAAPPAAPGSPPQHAEWVQTLARGALAALQVLPAAAEQQRVWQTWDLPSRVATECIRVVGACLEAMSGAMPAACWQLAEEATTAAGMRQQLGRLLRQVRAEACRLIHYAAAAAAAAAATVGASSTRIPQAAVYVLSDWARLVGILHAAAKRGQAYHAAMAARAIQPFSDRELQSMAAACKEAAAVALERGSAVMSAQGGAGQALDLADALLGAAVQAPPQAAALLTSGVLIDLLEVALDGGRDDEVAGEGSMPPHSAPYQHKVDGVHQGLANLMETLVRTSQGVGPPATGGTRACRADSGSSSSGGSSGGMSGGTIATEASGTAVPTAAAAAAGTDPPPPCSIEAAEVLRIYREEQLPRALELAAAVAAHEQQPEQQAAAQLAQAQAAASRSCAYLRCANLGAAGGCDAGEGEGSLRCSSCRAVWYCGTACSHADWRAGHKRVCKALAAARQAQRAAHAAH